MIDSQLVQILGLALVHFVWQGLLIGLLFLTGRQLLQGATAVARYNWAVGCLAMLALAPVVTFAWLSGSNGSSAVSGLAAMQQGLQTGAASSISASAGLSLETFLPAIVGLWLCGVVVMSARLGAGWWHVGQLRKQADFRVPAAIQAQLVQLSIRLSMARKVGLALSNQVAGPMLIGVFRPLILLPAGLINGLSPRQLEMVLAHELIHLQRADHLVNLFQNIVETLLFYHPVVRWVSNEIRAERELASDEQAARLTGDPVCYAETLLQLERVRGDRPQLAIGMADHQLLARVRHLLAPNPRQSGAVVSGMAILTLVLVSALAALVSTGLRTWTEQDPPAVTQATSTADSSLAAVEPSASPEPAEPPAIELDLLPEPVIDPVPQPTSDSFSQQTSPQPTVEVEPIVMAQAEVPAETRVEPSEPVEEAPAAIIPPEPEPQASEIPPVEIAALPEIRRPEPRAQEGLQLASLDPMPVTEIEGGALLNRVVPVYPTGAARQRREGHAEVRLIVGRDGRVVDAEIIEESPRGYGFGDAALRAVQQWQFEPFVQDGQAIRHQIQTGIDFTDPPECQRVTGTRINRC